MKRKPICPLCGGSDLRWDGLATWSIEDQQFELVTEYDKPITCSDCDDAEITPEWVDVAEHDAITLEPVLFEDLKVGESYLLQVGPAYKVTTKWKATVEVTSALMKRWRFP